MDRTDQPPGASPWGPLDVPSGDGVEEGGFDVVFADTCVGGSTVVARLAREGRGFRAFYLADYAVNPLGVKTRSQVREALDRWVDFAHGLAPHLIVACNTASVLLRATPEVSDRAEALGITIFSMLDFAEALIQGRPRDVSGRSVCLMGTEFTVGDPLYGDLLRSAGARSVLPLPATVTEGAIANLRHHLPEEREAIEEEIGQAVAEADSIVLACTCFPLIQDLVLKVNPTIRLLDPAGGVEKLPLKGTGEGPNLLTVALTGDALTAETVRVQAGALFPGWELEGVLGL